MSWVSPRGRNRKDAKVGERCRSEEKGKRKLGTAAVMERYINDEQEVWRWRHGQLGEYSVSEHRRKSWGNKHGDSGEGQVDGECCVRSTNLNF